MVDFLSLSAILKGEIPQFYKILFSKDIYPLFLYITIHKHLLWYFIRGQLKVNSYILVRNHKSIIRITFLLNLLINIFSHYYFIYKSIFFYYLFKMIHGYVPINFFPLNYTHTKYSYFLYKKISLYFRLIITTCTSMLTPLLLN